MRTCEWRISQIHHLVEGELTPEQEAELNEHLQVCSICAEQAREFARMKAAVEESFEAKLSLPDDDAVMRHAAVARPRGFMVGFWRKALVGAAACVAIVVLSAYLFVHFYFQRTFSHELKKMVIRCSNGIEKKLPNNEWEPLRAGDRLETAATIKTPAKTWSFMSFDGIRLWAEGEARFETKGRRALFLQEGELFVASAEKRKPLTVAAGNTSVRANGGAFRIARSGATTSVGVASGVVELDMPDGTTHKLVANQTATFAEKEAGFDVTSASVRDPFAAMRASVIDRIRRRFEAVIAKYAPKHLLMQKAMGGHMGSGILEISRRPEGMLQFASYTPETSFSLAKVRSDVIGEYYESLFVPSNRSISIGKQKVVPLPPGRAATFPRWSNDGSMIAFIETTPGSLVGRAKVVRLDDLDNPWCISQEFNTVRPMFPPAWAPDDRHVLFQVETGATWDRHGPTANFKIKIAPIDPDEGPLRDFNSPFQEIPLPLPLPVGKNISPSIEKLPWGDALICANWGNLAYVPAQPDGQAVPNAPGFFLTNFNQRECFVMGGGFSPSGSEMDFTGVRDLDFNAMSVYILYEVEDIIDGFTEPPRSFDDPRIKQVAPTENMQFTGGFSFDESLIFFHEDVNHAFDANSPTNIFACDFDVFYANALPGEPGMATQIHLPGNQMFLTPSPEGNRLAYCNYNWNHYELRIITFEIEADIDVDLGGVLIDNSGTNLIAPPGVLEENFSVKISTPLTIGDEAEIPVGESRFFAMRLLDAQGLENPKFIEPMTLTIRYTDEEVHGLDEGMLEIYYYDESHPEHPVWVPLGGTVDPDHNEITVEIQHFSKFSVRGRAPGVNPGK